MNLPSTATLIAVFLTGVIIGILGLLTTTPMFAGTGFGMMESNAMEDSEFNRADIMFMNMMIVHHEQAIEMSQLAPNRTTNETILELARNISKSQQSEIDTMSSWLNDAGRQRPRGMGHRMAGMASPKEMNLLEQSTGDEFDRRFANLMIDHHEGGIDMAQAEVQRGSHAGVVSLAEDMVRVQQREVDLMQQWLTAWEA
jgi:uncharacterized protein (DUF305 family)